MSQLRKWVFWPPFLVLLSAILYSLWDPKGFLSTVNSINQFFLGNLFDVFSWGALFILITVVGVYFSPLGKVIIGGKGAKPLLTKWRWFAIALCTNTAVGVLFWATAEPMYHFSAPPESLGIAPNSEAAAIYAMSTMYMHWSFIPCAIYALPALVFALCFYNLDRPFSLSSCLYPLMGKKSERYSNVIDAIALYALIAGMSSSLGTGIITLAGGMKHLYGIESSNLLYFVIGSLIVSAFVCSAVSGLQKGIRILSDINTKIFFFLLVFFLVFGPLGEIFNYSLLGLEDYANHFLQHSLFIDFKKSDPWPVSWTIFYWAVWMAWAPVSALFLGRIGYGYSVKTFILMNLVSPAIFAIVWMSTLGGTAMSLERSNQIDLVSLLGTDGPEALAYSVLETMPYPSIMIPVFLILVFIAYVTAADSNTTAMAGMSSKGVNAANPEAPLSIKITWGLILGSLSMIMLCLSGFEGIKTLSYLGGTPALFFELIVMVSLIYLAFNYKKVLHKV